MPLDVHSIVTELPALRRYALSLTRDRFGADTLVQEAVTRSVEKFYQYRPDTSLRSWLFAVMLTSFRNRDVGEAEDDRRVAGTGWTGKWAQPVAADSLGIYPRLSQRLCLRARRLRKLLSVVTGCRRCRAGFPLLASC